MELPTAESIFGKSLDQLDESERQILRVTRSICLWRSHHSLSDALAYYKRGKD